MESKNRICMNVNCSKPVKGRLDRKFCSDYCKSEHHYSKRINSGKHYFKLQVDEILRKNRKILSKYNKKSKVTIRKEELISEGFNPRFFTHYWKNQQGDTYLFCYDQGFKEVKDNNRQKYLLVEWQEYMSNSIL